MATKAESASERAQRRWRLASNVHNVFALTAFRRPPQRIASHPRLMSGFSSPQHSPGMQHEMRQIVFTQPPRQKNSHFKTGHMLLADAADYSTRLPRPKEPRTMESINDRAVSFDPVYGTRHEGKDTEAHFTGMVLTEPDGSASERHEQILKDRSDEAVAARERALCSTRPEELPEQLHMGHEQRDGLAGDTFDHFEDGGMALHMTPPPRHGLHRTLDHVSHFAAGGMAMASERDLPAALQQSRELRRQAFSAETLLNQQLYGSPNLVATSFFERPSLPDLHDPLNPASPSAMQPTSSALSREWAKQRAKHGAPGSQIERVAARKAARAVLPPAGSPSAFRELRYAERACMRKATRMHQHQQQVKAHCMTMPGAASSAEISADEYPQRPHRDHDPRTPLARCASSTLAGAMPQSCMSPVATPQCIRLSASAPILIHASPFRTAPSLEQHGRGVLQPDWWG